MTTNNLTWLAQWYAEQCNGDWEHSYGIKIETLDNPGWAVTINFEGTSHSQIKNKAWQLVEVDETNWHGFKIEDGKFEGSGDPYKLDFLINLFKEIVTQQS
jgi:Immunity protein 53